MACPHPPARIRTTGRTKRTRCNCARGYQIRELFVCDACGAEFTAAQLKYLRRRL